MCAHQTVHAIIGFKLSTFYFYDLHNNAGHRKRNEWPPKREDVPCSLAIGRCLPPMDSTPLKYSLGNAVFAI